MSDGLHLGSQSPSLQNEKGKRTDSRTAASAVLGLAIEFTRGLRRLAINYRPFGTEQNPEVGSLNSEGNARGSAGSEVVIQESGGRIFKSALPPVSLLSVFHAFPCSRVYAATFGFEEGFRVDIDNASTIALNLPTNQNNGKRSSGIALEKFPDSIRCSTGVEAGGC